MAIAIRTAFELQSLASTHPLLAAGFGWLAVTGLAWLANKTGSLLWAAVFCLAVGLFLFCLLHESEIQRLVALRRDGWYLTTALILAVVLAPHLGILLVVKGYFKAIFIQPTLKEALHFWGEKLILTFGLAAAEEFFFRGCLQEELFRRPWPREGRWLSRKNLAASVLFGLAHVISHGSWLRGSSFFSGFLFGYVTERSKGSLCPAILIHTVSNAAGSWFWLLAGLNMPFS